MFTMVASRTTISWAMPMKANAFHRCGSGAGVVVPAGAEDMGELRFEKRGIRWGAAGRRPPNTVQGTRAPPAAAGPVVARTGRAPQPACSAAGSVGPQRLDVPADARRLRCQRWPGGVGGAVQRAGVVGRSGGEQLGP